MKITALRLFNVKRFAGRGVAIENIGNGVNVLSAANEFGKSTSFEALHALFFRPHSGSPKDIKRMQPYSGGNPVVEADIVTAEGRFKLAKQFLGGKRANVVNLDTGQLVAQADEAERFILNLTRGGLAGPSGMLWVRQGQTELEDNNKSNAESERQVRETLLSSVQGEVEAITGGRRMGEIVEACTQQLDLMIARTRRIRAGSDYDTACKQHEHLKAEEARLASEVGTLHDALDERNRLKTRVAELDGEVARTERQKSLDEAIAAHEHAKGRADALRIAEAEEAQAATSLDNVQQEFDRFGALLTSASSISAALSEADARQEETHSRQKYAAQKIEEVDATFNAAEVEEAECRDLLKRLDDAMKARKAADELNALRQTLAKVDGINQKIADARTQAALLAVPESALEKGQNLEARIAGLRSARDLGRPTLRINYDENRADVVLLDGAPIQENQEIGFGTSAELRLQGIGTLHLRSNRAENQDEELGAAEQSLRDLLDAIGVSSLGEGRKRFAEGQEKLRSIKSLEEQLQHLIPNGMDILREEVVRRETLRPDDLELKGDPELARLALNQATQNRTTAKNDWREAQPALQRANDELSTARSEVALLSGKLEEAESALGPEETRSERRAALETELQEKRADFDGKKQIADELRQSAPDMLSVEARLKRAQSVQQAAADEMAQLRERLAELNGEIRTRSEEAIEEAWIEAKEALSGAAARVQGFEREVAILTTLSAELDAARSQARDLYLKPVMGELGPLLDLLFEDASIVFDEKTLLPQSIRRNGLEEEVDRLSGGMREQLSILTRLAFARLMSRSGKSAPVILDDALVYSDDDRIERMFDALHRQADDQQIIVFTCRQRAFSQLGGNVLRMTEWRPQES